MGNRSPHLHHSDKSPQIWSTAYLVHVGGFFSDEILLVFVFRKGWLRSSLIRWLMLSRENDINHGTTEIMFL